jgi:nucleoside-diphosphate-sugar epimerase
MGSPDWDTGGPTEMNVIVTGASGFVGRALVRYLSESGQTVFLGLRQSTYRSPEQTASEMSVAIDESTGQFDIPGKIDAVIHLAGIAHTRGVDKQQYYDANAEWPRKLAAQAASLGIPRFIFVSTAKVLPSSRSTFPDETNMPRSTDPYTSSKEAAEQLLANVAQQMGIGITVLRPPLVYGPGVKANFLSLMRIVDGGWPLPLSLVNNRRSLIYVGNLSSAIETCLTHPAAVNRTYFVSDDRDVSTPELIRLVNNALGRRPSPVSWLKIAGQALGRSEQISRLTESLQVDITAIKQEIGWTPPFTIEEGLRETAQWYRSVYGRNRRI